MNRCKNAVRTAKIEQENQAYRNLDPIVQLVINTLSPEVEARVKFSISSKGELEK